MSESDLKKTKILAKRESVSPKYKSSRNNLDSVTLIELRNSIQSTNVSFTKSSENSSKRDSFKSKSNEEKLVYLYSRLNNLYLTEEFSNVYKIRKNYKLITKLNREYELFFKLDDEMKAKYIHFTIDYLDYITKNFNVELDGSSFEELTHKISFFGCLLNILLNITNSSEKISTLFHSNPKNGIQKLANLLKELERALHYFDEKKKKQVEQLIEIVLGCLNNLSKVAYNFKQIWKDIGYISFVYELSLKFGYISATCKLVTYLIMANIASDEDIKSMDKYLSNVILEIVSRVKVIATQLEDSNIDRVKIFLEDNQSVLIAREENGFDLDELITALYQFSKSDRIKYLIYHDFQIKETLHKIIKFGNQAENEIAFKLLYQLSFDDKIAEDIMTDEFTYEHIKRYSTHSNNCQGILSVIDNKFNKPIHDSTETSSEDKKHIMISYNSKSRSVCYKIKEELEKLGKKCWIDVDNIGGDSIKAMAKAIKQASCVLMCITEKYYESSNCRLEADYTFKLKKPFIPILMQKGYKPEDWLDMIIGNKIFIDITKYDSFDKYFREILKQIKIAESDSTDTDIKTNDNSKTNEKIEIGDKWSGVKKWSILEVEKWFIEKKVNTNIVSILNQADGDILYELHKIYSKTPKLFYEYIRHESNSQLKLIDLLKFSSELDKLFSE